MLSLINILNENWCIKNHKFTYEFLLEPSLLELYHDSLPGLWRWEGGSSRGLWYELWIVFPWPNKGRDNSWAEAQLLLCWQQPEWTHVEISPRVAFSFIYSLFTTTTSWTPWNIGLLYPLELLSLLCLIQLHNDRDSKERFLCADNFFFFIEQFVGKYVSWNFTEAIISSE